MTAATEASLTHPAEIGNLSCVKRIPQEKKSAALELSDCVGVARASAETGVPRGTLARWRKERRDGPRPRKRPGPRPGLPKREDSALVPAEVVVSPPASNIRVTLASGLIVEGLDADAATTLVLALQ